MKLRLTAFAGKPKDEQWNTNFQLLKAYVKKHKAYPSQAEGNLGTWLSSQRAAYNKETLSPDRIRRLESLSKWSPWSWNPLTDKWNEKFQLLQAYLKGPENKYNEYPSKNTPEGKWLSNQRSLFSPAEPKPVNNSQKNNLSDEEITRRKNLLKELPNWDSWFLGTSYLSLRKTLAQIQWINTYEEFKQWVQKNGMFPRLAKKDAKEFKLSCWLSIQRNEKSPYRDIEFTELEKATFPSDQVFNSRTDALKNFKLNDKVIDLLAEDFAKNYLSLEARPRYLSESDLSIADWCAILKDFADRTVDNPHYPNVKVTTPEYGPVDGKTANEKRMADWLGVAQIIEGRLFLRGIERSGLSPEQIATIKNIKNLSRFSEEYKEKFREAFKLFWEQNDGRYPSAQSFKPEWPNKKEYGAVGDQKGITESQLYNWYLGEQKNDPLFFKQFPRPSREVSKAQYNSGRTLFAQFMEAKVKEFLGEAYANLTLYNKGLSGCDYYMTDNNTSISNIINRELTPKETTELQTAKTLFFYDVKSCHLGRCPQTTKTQQELKKIIESLYVIGVSKDKEKIEDILKFEIVTIAYSSDKKKQELSFSLKIDDKVLSSEKMTFGELSAQLFHESKDNVIYFLSHLGVFKYELGTLMTTIPTNPIKMKWRKSEPLCKKTKDMIYVFLKNKFPNQSDLLKSIVYAERQLKVAKLRIGRWIKQ